MILLKQLISLMKPFIDRFPPAAVTYRRIRNRLQAMEDPVVTPWGFKLAGNRAMAQGAFEPMETELVRNILKDIDILVDVGANIGYYCCHALNMGKSVIAFEPIKRNLRYLYRNIRVNKWSSAEIHPLALFNSVGMVKIYGGNTGASLVKGWAGTPESYVALVPSSTLDVVLGTRLRGKRALVIVDVEGGEKWVLEGATKILSNDPKPIWMVEVTTEEHQPRGVAVKPNFKDVFQLFFQNGYQAFSIDRNMRLITTEDVDMAFEGSTTFTAHNFLFSEPKTVV